VVAKETLRTFCTTLAAFAKREAFFCVIKSQCKKTTTRAKRTQDPLDGATRELSESKDDKDEANDKRGRLHWWKGRQQSKKERSLITARRGSSQLHTIEWIDRLSDWKVDWRRVVDNKLTAD